MTLEYACWRHQPAIMASNSAGSGRSGVAPSTSTKDADPANLATGTSPSRHRKPQSRTRCNTIRWRTVASGVDQLVDGQPELGSPRALS